jgi:tetratricopeptide (TPR) repeat protein
MPESPSALEHGFEIRLQLRPVLNQLGEIRTALGLLDEAEALAERLNDDRRRGRVYAFAANNCVISGEVDRALASGTRALEIAQSLGDRELRILATTTLEQVHYVCGEYPRVIQLAGDSLAILPADRIYESFGNIAPASVYDRGWLVAAFSQLGRFTEAAQYEEAAIRLAEPTRNAYTIGIVGLVAGVLYPLKGEWAMAHLRLERAIDVYRSANLLLMLPYVVASSARVLAQLGEAEKALERLREAEELLERPGRKGIGGERGWAFNSLGRASLLLGRLDEAQRWADRVIESLPGQRGFAAHARHLLGEIAAHPDRFDPSLAETHYTQALALADSLGMRPLVAHSHLGLGTLYRRIGDHAKGHEHLTVAAAMSREMDMPFWLTKAEGAMRVAAT